MDDPSKLRHRLIIPMVIAALWTVQPVFPNEPDSSVISQPVETPLPHALLHQPATQADFAAGSMKTDPLPFAGMAELSVDALVEVVLARNPSLAQMIAAQQAAAARYPQVTSLDDPSLGLMLAPQSIGSNEVDFGGRIELSQKFLFPGKLHLKGQAALAEASAAGQDVEDMRLQLVKSARIAFYDYFLAERARDVNQEGLQLLQEFTKYAEARYKTGRVPQQDVLQAEVEAGRQREQGLMLDRMRKVALARINTLMHLSPDSPLPPAPGRLAVGGTLPPVEVLRVQALARRPDLQALADRLTADEAALALANKEYCPDFEVVAAYDSIMGNGPTRDLAPQVGVRVNLPVRIAKRNGAIAEALAALAKRRAELDAKIDQINYQVQEAYEQLLESEKIVLLYDTTLVPAARENVKAAQAAYITGRTPFLSLMQAQRNLIELQDRFYSNTADYFRRQAALENAIGGPLTPLTPDGHR
jgi:outer membrane protein TolC